MRLASTCCGPSAGFPSFTVVRPLSQLLYKQTNKATKQMDMCLQLHRWHAVCCVFQLVLRGANVTAVGASILPAATRVVKAATHT